MDAAPADAPSADAVSAIIAIDGIIRYDSMKNHAR